MSAVFSRVKEKPLLIKKNKTDWHDADFRHLCGNISQTYLYTHSWLQCDYTPTIVADKFTVAL